MKSVWTAIDYLKQSQHYFKNAQELYAKGERAKATELVWGSVAEAVKALAASRGIDLRTHQSLREYVYKIAGQIRDAEFQQLFNDVEGAHRNFYQEFMKDREIQEVFAKAQEFLRRANELIRRRTGSFYYQ